ncbi:hypothetical protein CsatA_001181 [Cannabis sativa]
MCDFLDCTEIMQSSCAIATSSSSSCAIATPTLKLPRSIQMPRSQPCRPLVQLLRPALSREKSRKRGTGRVDREREGLREWRELKRDREGEQASVGISSIGCGRMPHRGWAEVRRR